MSLEVEYSLYWFLIWGLSNLLPTESGTDSYQNILQNFALTCRIFYIANMDSNVCNRKETDSIF